MSEKINFNLHNLLSFSIETASKTNIMRDVNYFYSYFETNDIEDPDIKIKIGKFDPANAGCYLVDHKYYVNDNYFYCKDRYERAEWKVEIFGFEEGKAEINFSGNIFGLEKFLIPDFLVQSQILRPLIELKMLKKGFVLVHGLGLEKNGNAYIFSARGGAHKSRIAASIINNSDVKLIGDDWVIIGKDGSVYSYPLFFKTIKYKSRYLSKRWPYPFMDKLNWLYYLISFNEKFSSDFIADRSHLKAMFFSIRKVDNVRVSNRGLNSSNAATRLTNSNQLEMINGSYMGWLPISFYKYMLAYSYIFPHSYIGTYYSNLRQNFVEILGKVSNYEIDMKEQYDSSVTGAVLELANS